MGQREPVARIEALYGNECPGSAKRRPSAAHAFAPTQSTMRRADIPFSPMLPRAALGVGEALKGWPMSSRGRVGLERRTHKIANGDRSLADRAAQLVEVRRPYRLFVESAAARLITNRVALMTRSG